MTNKTICVLTLFGHLLILISFFCETFTLKQEANIIIATVYFKKGGYFWRAKVFGGASAGKNPAANTVVGDD
jgi:hypothetical protein